MARLSPIFLAATALSLPAAAAILAPAAPQPPAVSTTLRQADLRVAGVAYRLGLQGLPYCKNSYPLTGMLMHHLAEYEPADRALMVATYGLDRGPGVLSVLADSEAGRAGLVAGDVLLDVNGAAFPSPAEMATEAKRKTWRKQIETSELQLEEQLRKGPARLRVLREGRELALTLGSVSACPIRVRLARSAQMNAFATGSYVIITTRLLDFLKSDDELAVVIGHELSHNILGHPALLDEQGVPKRGVLRGLGSNATKVWATEAEADRLSVPLVWRGGFDLNAAMPFWRRLSANYDFLPQIFRTHPSIGAKERIVREAIAALPASTVTP